MVDVLRHRGPDNSGFWVCEENGIALGHNRLSINDLSSSGNQPMQSSSKRYTIVFNGEIYNFNDLKNSLHRKKILVLIAHQTQKHSLNILNALDYLKLYLLVSECFLSPYGITISKH